MADIRMVKFHQLPMARARALVQQAADDLAQEYDLASEWDGDSLRFSRSGVDGRMDVSAGEITLEVRLGFLLKPFKARFVEHIEHNFDRLLDEAHGHHAAARTAAKAPAKTAAKAAKGSARVESAGKTAAKARARRG